MDEQNSAFIPLKVQSLKEACVTQLENLVLSGELKIGQRLPSERDLARSLNVSRPVLHEALVEMALKGVVTIIPRKGIFINDFRRTGSTAFLASLLNYHNGKMEKDFERSMMDTRILLETETARMAALHCTQPELKDLKELIQIEQHSDIKDSKNITELDFNFHLQIAIIGKNLVYPLIINSFKTVYTSLTGTFFTKYAGSPIINEVFNFHERLLQAIEQKQPDKAADIMRQMLVQGQEYLLKGA
jgi:GntR family transcriptional repressor for pyruvate dehydrogenase complex